MALFSEKSWDEWVEEYGQSHQHPINRRCHTIGIPLVVISLLSVPLALLSVFPWFAVIGPFVVGWVFQFVGHYFEKKPPEFFKDWRFLLVGTRWWVRKTFAKYN